MQSYMSSVVGIDTQSIIHGRPQQKNFYGELYSKDV